MHNRRIILWGAGQWSLEHYKEIYDNLRQDICIVGIADNNYEKLNQKYTSVYDMYGFSLEYNTILSIENVKELYDAEKIDSVFLGVYFDNYKEVKKQLDAINIPLFSKFVSCPDMKENCTDEKIWNGIYVYVMKNIIAYHDFCASWRLVSWLCTDAGILIDEMENYVHLHGKTPPWFLLSDFGRNVTEVDECCVLSGKYCLNYWHFTYEILPIIHLFEKNGYTGMYMLHYREFSAELLNFYGINQERIIWVKDEEVPPVYRIRKMYCTEHLHSMFDNKNIGNITKLNVEVSDILIQKVCKGINLETYPKRIYVKRITNRKLVANEELLKKYGFVTIVPEELTVEEQIRYFCAADIVLSPHGANSSNALYMRKGKCFIETFPWNHITPCCNFLLKEKEVNYFMVVERFGRGGNVDIGPLNRNYGLTDIDLELAILSAINTLEARGEME